MFKNVLMQIARRVGKQLDKLSVKMDRWFLSTMKERAKARVHNLELPTGIKSFEESLDSDKRKLETDFYFAVGSSLSIWSAVETGIVTIVGYLLGAKDDRRVGIIMYSNMNFGSWLHIATDLFSLEPDLNVFKNRFNKKAHEMRKLKEIRDRLAHHTTMTPGDDHFPSLKPTHLDYRTKSVKYKPLDIDGVIDFGKRSLDMYWALRSLHTDMVIYAKERVALLEKSPR